MNLEELKFVEKTLGISIDILDPWREKINLEQYKIGELILNQNKISKSILVLLEGKIRIRASKMTFC